MAERIQKILATMGMGSRRQLEAMIEEGRIRINGEVAKLGDRAEYSDRIHVDGRVVKLHYRPKEKHRVLAYNKPEGEICSRSDPEGRPTIFDNLPKLRSGRWVAVGRLDINTSGLILLTTDGELANKLMHPSSEIEREYAVRIMGEVDKSVLKLLRKGVELEDGPAKFNEVRDAGGQGFNHWYHVTLSEGRKREVRRLWESQGFTVSRLIRLRYGEIKLDRSVRTGTWSELGRAELDYLYESVGLSAAPEAEEKPKGHRRGAKPASSARKKNTRRDQPRAGARRPRR